MNLPLFALVLLISILLVMLTHELGHLIPIMLFNITENRLFYHFHIEINWKYFYIVNAKFENPYKNLIVAVSGTLLPIIISIVLLLIESNSFTNIYAFLSFICIVMLHPKLPDGKNVVEILEEMRG